eukprot:6173868-Pleurochrysis_carterae.AAC.2
MYVSAYVDAHVAAPMCVRAHTQKARGHHPDSGWRTRRQDAPNMQRARRARLQTRSNSCTGPFKWTSITSTPDLRYTLATYER